MINSEYISFYGITDLQREIMGIVSRWARANKTPIPHKEIIVSMKKLKVADYSTINAIRSLIKKGYIRKAVIVSNKTYYVQLRNL